MEGKVPAELHGKKRSFEEEEEAMAASSAIFSFLAHPMSLLRHVAHTCAGYLKLKPGTAAAAAASRQEEAAAAATCCEQEEDCAVVVEVRSRGVPPQRPRGLKEGRGGNGGTHRKK